jgi:hypothetical protein
MSEREIFYRCRSRLVPSYTSSIALTKLRKAEAIKFIGVWIDFSIRVDSRRWDSDQRTRRNGDSIGKREWA